MLHKSSTINSKSLTCSGRVYQIWEISVKAAILILSKQQKRSACGAWQFTPCATSVQGVRGNISSLEKYDLFTGKNNNKNNNPCSARKERNSLHHYQQRHAGVKCRDLGPHVIFGDGKSRKGRSQEPLYAAKEMLLHLYLPVCCLSV